MQSYGKTFRFFLVKVKPACPRRDCYKVRLCLSRYLLRSQTLNSIAYIVMAGQKTVAVLYIYMCHPDIQTKNKRYLFFQWGVTYNIYRYYKLLLTFLRYILYFLMVITIFLYILYILYIYLVFSSRKTLRRRKR